MRVIKPGTKAGNYVEGVFQINGDGFFFSLVSQLAQILAKKVFHGDKVFAIQIAKVINLNNIFVL